MGRIDHLKRGDQTGADMERVEAALQRLELVHVELEPGSAVLFHGNTLHRSDQNQSEHPRWAFICCYNSRSNDPYRDGRHPRYSPLQRIAADEVVLTGRRHLAQVQRSLG
jgi:ectoine hydroxylase-related dioxygenase (phytanoyl-CoA dioxygenase family)